MCSLLATIVFSIAAYHYYYTISILPYIETTFNKVYLNFELKATITVFREKHILSEITSS